MTLFPPEFFKFFFIRFRELKVADIGLDKSTSFVSCLSFSNQSPNILTAGFGDGVVRVWDVRAGGAGSRPVMSHGEHGRSPVLDCQLQDVGGFSGDVVSGAADGGIKVADPRRAAGAGGSVIKSLHLGQPLNALAIHKRAFAVAAWTLSHSAVVHSLLGSGGQLNAVRQHSEGLLGHRRGPVGCLAFHPHLLQLATGPADGNVGVYSLRRTM